MLLRVLKSNQPFILILAPLIGAALWAAGWIKPEIYAYYPGEDQMALFQPVSLFLMRWPRLQLGIAFVLLVFSGYYIEKINRKYSLHRARTFLPTVLFILLASAIKDLHSLHPVYFAVPFLLFSIDRMFDAYGKKMLHSNAFDTGFLLATGSLFYFNFVFLFPALLTSLILINRDFSWRDLVLIFLGMILPWAFAFSYYFGFDKIQEFADIVSQNFITGNNHLNGNIPVLVFLGVAAVFVILGTARILRQLDERKVSTRNYYTTFFFVFLFSALTLICIPAVSYEVMVVLAVPLSFLMSNYFVSLKKNWLGEILFLALAGSIIYLQLAGLING